MRQMVANDGVENPAIDFHPLPQHGYSSDVMESSSVVATMLEKGLSDSTWIFEHWEGVLAARSGKSLNYFRLEDYDIPYGYSPIILANPALLQDNAAAAVARDFLAASENGFTVAATNCRAAATDLQQEGCHSTLSDLEFLVHSQELISSAYLDENGRWGTMKPGRWRAFLDFMLVNDIVVDDRNTGIDFENISAPVCSPTSFCLLCLVCEHLPAEYTLCLCPSDVYIPNIHPRAARCNSSSRAGGTPISGESNPRS